MISASLRLTPIRVVSNSRSKKGRRFSINYKLRSEFVICCTNLYLFNYLILTIPKLSRYFFSLEVPKIEMRFSCKLTEAFELTHLLSEIMNQVDMALYLTTMRKEMKINPIWPNASSRIDSRLKHLFNSVT